MFGEPKPMRKQKKRAMSPQANKTWPRTIHLRTGDYKYLHRRQITEHLQDNHIEVKCLQRDHLLTLAHLHHKTALLQKGPVMVDHKSGSSQAVHQILGEGHPPAECRNLVCHVCGEVGHRVSECRQSKGHVPSADPKSTSPTSALSPTKILITNPQERQSPRLLRHKSNGEGNPQANPSPPSTSPPPTGAAAQPPPPSPT